MSITFRSGGLCEIQTWKTIPVQSMYTCHWTTEGEPVATEITHKAKATYYLI